MESQTSRGFVFIAGLVVALGWGCTDPISGPQGPAVTLVGAGDIALCESQDDEATARLLDFIPGTVFTAGDNAYPNGSAQDFSDCFAPSWGRHLARTRPSPGNHDYQTPDASGYFEYFGTRAGASSEGYYSYDLGSWHVVVLNSNVDAAAGSPQLQWLAADLALSQSLCTVAYWHHPRFSSGPHGNDASVEPFWQVLYEAGVEIVLNGHDHHFERFAPQNPDGVPDASGGIREFVVGTGGSSLRSILAVAPNSEVRNADAHGVLKLSLYAESYEWEFIPVPGAAFRDSGRDTCHASDSVTP